MVGLVGSAATVLALGGFEVECVCGWVGVCMLEGEYICVHATWQKEGVVMGVSHHKKTNNFLTDSQFSILL